MMKLIYTYFMLMTHCYIALKNSLVNVNDSYVLRCFSFAYYDVNESTLKKTELSDVRNSKHVTF